MIADPIKSVVDFPFYQDVPKKSFPAIFGYIAYLGMLYSCVVVIALVVHFKPRIQEGVDWAAASIPDLTLTEGRLSSAARGRTVVRHPEIDQLVVVIDTDRSEAVTPAEMSEQKAFAYLTQNTIYVLDGNHTLKAYDLSKAKNEKPFKIDAEFYKSLSSIMTIVLYPTSFVTAWIIFLFWKHAAALVYTLMALLINAGIGGRLEFADLYKLSVYAQTPVIILQMITLLLLKPIPYFNILAFLVVGAYLWQGIKQHMPPPEPAQDV